MIFSKSCEYGIRATIYIAQQSMNKKRSSLKSISKEIDSPEAFTAKILQMLTKGGIIDSVRGATGGFQIEQKNSKKIKLIDIIRAIDGDIGEKTCVLGLKVCSEVNPCPVHHKYMHIKKNLLAMLQDTRLLEMSDSINKGLSCLKIN
ncbi:MAG: Rrf2 family transcriptional regulator [Bacteroidia bacterium]